MRDRPERVAEESTLVTRSFGTATFEHIRDGARVDSRARTDSLLEEWSCLVVQLRGEPGKIAIFERESAALPMLTGLRECVWIRFPASAFRGLPNRSGAEVERLCCPPELGIVEPVVLALVESLVEATDEHGNPRRQVVEHVLRAILIHLASRFGEPCAAARELEPPWLGRARELLSSVASQCSVDDVAAACGLSSSAFSRAFRKHVGLPPHRFQLRARIERAKAQLAGPSSLTEIALGCGFADQSHFSRTFRAITGATPRRFRATAGRAHG